MPEFDYDAALSVDPAEPTCAKCGGSDLMQIAGTREGDYAVVSAACQRCRYRPFEEVGFSAWGRYRYLLAGLESEGGPLSDHQVSLYRVRVRCPFCQAMEEEGVTRGVIDVERDDNRLNSFGRAIAVCDVCDQVWSELYQYDARI